MVGAEEREYSVSDIHFNDRYNIKSNGPDYARKDGSSLESRLAVAARSKVS